MAKSPKPPKGRRNDDVRTPERTITCIRAGRLDSSSHSKPVEIAVDWTDGGDRHILSTYPEVDSFQRYHIPGEFWPLVYPVDMQVSIVRITEIAIWECNDPKNIPQNARVLIPEPHRPIRKIDRAAMIALTEGTEDASELVDYEKSNIKIWVSLADFEALLLANGEGGR